MRAVILLGALGALAPLQCPSPRGPELAREESPGEALWMLAERFGEQRNEGSRRATLFTKDEGVRDMGVPPGAWASQAASVAPGGRWAAGAAPGD